MKQVVVLSVLLCACAPSLGAVSYSGATKTLTYGSPGDLVSVIDPASVAPLVDADAEIGMTKAAFLALNPQVVDFNNAPGALIDPVSNLVVQYNPTSTVTFAFPTNGSAENYMWGGNNLGGGRTAFSGQQPYDCLRACQYGDVDHSWFDAAITLPAGQLLTALAMCVCPRQDLNQGISAPNSLVFTLSDGSTETLNVGLIGGSTDGNQGPLHPFIGYQAPAGLGIVNVHALRPRNGNSYPNIDDLSFVITPEPATLTLLALGGLALLRRRHD